MYYLWQVPFTTLAYFLLPLLTCEMISRLLQFAEDELITTKDARIHIQKRLFLTIIAAYLLPLLLIQFSLLLQKGIILMIFGIFGLILITPLTFAFAFHAVRSTGLVSKELYKIFSKELLENFGWIEKFKK